ncbi:MAG: tRNA (cytosine(32)/uridine(32)-2'-O)-methyltransferase TrmJ [Gammaproteobacteria bacterium HGW-Gammaproteobacteria-14]|nr:MAG: tRNA (cytosine(32)/uridine(32)-2'-O)-methyltransferase TrmJ [Gammaproteobacteria bacterium HGW-Gammaproteobacteria-14]
MLDRLRIVMVETRHPGNIGAAARAMKTMGLSDLRLVQPVKFPDPEATARATGGAADVLENARVCSTLDEAIGDADLVVGTSARQRRIPWPCITPRQLGDRIAAEPNMKVAVMFGREDRGLTNEELQRCNLHVSIPSDAAYGVLNVASAVQLISYELRLAVLGDEVERPEARSRRNVMPLPELVWDEPLASNQDVDRLLTHFEQVALESGFLDPENPAQVVTRLRRLFMRARPDKMEVSILRGMLATIQKRWNQ